MSVRPDDIAKVIIQALQFMAMAGGERRKN
jgi:hypothetical protein